MGGPPGVQAVEAVAGYLRAIPEGERPLLVVDPVLVATSGHALGKACPFPSQLHGHAHCTPFRHLLALRPGMWEHESAHPPCTRWLPRFPFTSVHSVSYVSWHTSQNRSRKQSTF